MKLSVKRMYRKRNSKIIRADVVDAHGNESTWERKMKHQVWECIKGDTAKICPRSNCKTYAITLNTYYDRWRYTQTV